MSDLDDLLKQIQVIVKVVVTTVPGLCIISGLFIAVLLKDVSGWLVFLIGVGLQVLYLWLNRRQ